MKIVEYLDDQGRSPFAKWFSRLPPIAASRVTIALARLENGNISAVEAVGQGVHEVRVDFGPGYRIYFGNDGEDWVILLAGGSKKRQQDDIEDAKVRWEDFKRRKGK